MHERQPISISRTYMTEPITEDGLAAGDCFKNIPMARESARPATHLLLGPIQ